MQPQRENETGVAGQGQGDPLAPALPGTQPPSVVPGTPIGTGVPSLPTQNVVSSPLQADDNDNIEREWVELTKKVILENQGDPHALSDAVARLRQDYIKKRYGKDVKVPEN